MRADTICAEGLRGMNNKALQAVFRSTVVAKLLYAASARSCFIKMTDWQRVDACLRRSKKCGYCSPDLPTFEEQCDSMDQKLFDNILANQGLSAVKSTSSTFNSFT